MRGEEGVVRRQPAGHLCGVTPGEAEEIVQLVR